MSCFAGSQSRVRADVFLSAASLVGKAKYCFLSEACDPPRSVNCGMLVRWAFARAGFWDYAGIYGPAIGSELLRELKVWSRSVCYGGVGDIVFIEQFGRIYEHVGIIGFNDQVVHACWQRGTVVIDLTVDFWRASKSKPRIYSLF